MTKRWYLKVVFWICILIAAVSMTEKGAVAEEMFGEFVRDGDYMPTVIVEIGFHSNPSDAVWLKDGAFQLAAMKGVEKGWRLYRQGKLAYPSTSDFCPTFPARKTRQFH